MTVADRSPSLPAAANHDAPSVAVWYAFRRGPYGGANQFLAALVEELRRQGVNVTINRAGADVHLTNTNSLPPEELEQLAARGDFRLIQRVDGAMAIYRGGDWNTDRYIYEINARYAKATVYQSDWCCRQALDLGFKPVNPVVIRNAVDPAIFHAKGRRERLAGERIRLISTAWSDNPMKGGPLLAELEGLLDWDRYEFTFVGRTRQTFRHIRCVPSVGSAELAASLREHDVYVMASRSEACSNALLEALACGLPAAYVDDGGNPELVGAGGVPFQSAVEAAAAIDRIAADLDACRSRIHLATMAQTAAAYIALARQVAGQQ